MCPWPVRAIITLFIDRNSYIAFHLVPWPLTCGDLESHRSRNVSLMPNAFSQSIFEQETSS